MIAKHDAKRVAPSWKVEAAARARLRQAGRPALRNVRCRFRRGRLHLRGVVPSYYHKQLAQESVRSLKPVEQIVNEIEVVNKVAAAR